MYESDYQTILLQVFGPILDRINKIEDHEIREYFRITINAAERSLHHILFSSPVEFNFRKSITKEDIEFWLHRVSLAIMSYSFYFFGDNPNLDKFPELKKLTDVSYKIYWDRMFGNFNQIFDANVGQVEIDHYAAGLKEDNEKGYSVSGNATKSMELAIQDGRTIGSELLNAIWHENIETSEKKGLLLGNFVWRAYQQIVQPFLGELLNT